MAKAPTKKAVPAATTEDLNSATEPATATASGDTIEATAETDAEAEATAKANAEALANPDAGDTPDLTDPATDPAMDGDVPEGYVRMVHTDSTDHSGVSFGGVTYVPGDDGSIVVPGPAAEALKSHGFKQA